MFYFNTLNLIQISGGNQVKQGDFGSTFAYNLADEKSREIDAFDQKTAYVNLVLNNNIVFTTTVIVEGSTVTFNIDKAIPTGLYFLEIKIDSYIFPSDRQTIILVEEGAVAYDLKDLVPNYDTNMTISGILSDLSQKGIDITDLKTKMSAIYDNALADHAEIIQARGGQSSLDARLDGLDLKDTDLQSQINTNKTSIATTGSRIDNLIANAGNGTVPSELTDIRVAYNGTTYPTAGQAVREQFKNSVKGIKNIVASPDVVSPYNDLDTLPVNTIVTYSYYDGVSNMPSGYVGGATVLTYNYEGGSNISGAVQILATPNGETFTRIFWGLPGTDKWKPWEKIVTEKSIDTIPAVNNSVKGIKKIVASPDVVAPYNDLDTLPVNTIVLYAYYDGVSNMPSGYVGGATVLTYNYAGGAEISGAVQILTTPNGDTYTRIFWGLPGKDTWKPWKKTLTEKDLQQNNIDTDPFQPSLALFEKIGVIGDSYASGEIYPGGIPDDKYSVSWGQILARKNGVKCTNFSRGGFTTRTWLTDEMGLAKLNSSEPQNLYYISLGINEDYSMGTGYIGTEADMDSGADTFYGNYAKIIKAVQAKAPNSKIIIIDYAWAESDDDPYFVATKNIATKFGLPLIKHRDDSFLSSDKFKSQLMEYGHPVAISYAAMASAFEKLTMKAIRDNIAYFKDYRG